MILVCLFFAVVVGALAKRKNRNPWLWGFAGAMSWLISLLALAFLPYRCETGEHDVTNEQAKEKICPACSIMLGDTPRRAPGTTAMF